METKRPIVDYILTSKIQNIFNISEHWVFFFVYIKVKPIMASHERTRKNSNCWFNIIGFCAVDVDFDRKVPWYWEVLWMIPEFFFVFNRKRLSASSPKRNTILISYIFFDFSTKFFTRKQYWIEMVLVLLCFVFAFLLLIL